MNQCDEGRSPVAGRVGTFVLWALVQGCAVPISGPDADAGVAMEAAVAPIVQLGPGADAAVPPTEDVAPIQPGPDACSVPTNPEPLPTPVADASPPDTERSAQTLDDPTQAELDNIARLRDAGLRRDVGQPPSDAGASDAVAEAAADAGHCTPMDCGTYAWACWPMPNDPDSGLPNQARYTDLHDGTVRDEVTCLEWQKEVTRASKAWSHLEAVSYCQQLGIAGKKWRLPTRVELVSITDMRRTTPAINLESFPSAPPTYFWSATKWVSRPSVKPTSWVVDFYAGQAVGNLDESGWFSTRCVRDVAAEAGPPVHYDEIAIGEVQDRYTGLIWQQSDSQPLSSGLSGWKDAITYCAGLKLNGHTWRLPSIKELATILDDETAQAERPRPLVNAKAFPGIHPALPYWSSTPFANRPDSQAWTLEFSQGTTKYQETTAYAKCVR